ncbi:MAG: hypothetical protein R3C05_30960 [Pirellulaceae bacterium]
MKRRERLKKIDAEIAAAKRCGWYKNKAVAALRSDAVAKASDYLAACTLFDTNASLQQITNIAQPLGLHPRMLHHCRRHLEFNRQDPVFLKWHELAGGGDKQAIAEHYRQLFENAQSKLAEAKGRDPKATSTGDDALDAALKAAQRSIRFLDRSREARVRFGRAHVGRIQSADGDCSGSGKQRSRRNVRDGGDRSNGLDLIADSYSRESSESGTPRCARIPEVMRTSIVRPILPIIKVVDCNSLNGWPIQAIH